MSVNGLPIFSNTGYVKNYLLYSFKHNNHRIFRKWGQKSQHRESKKTSTYVNKHGFDSFIRKTVISPHLTVPLFISPFLTEPIILLLLAVPFYHWWVTLEPQSPFSNPPLTIPVSKVQRVTVGGKLSVNLNPQREMSLNPKSCPGVSWFIGPRLYSVLCNTDELLRKRMTRVGRAEHRWLIHLRVWLPNRVTLRHCHDKNTPASNFKSHSAIGNKVLELADGQCQKDSWYIDLCLHAPFIWDGS